MNTAQISKKINGLTLSEAKYTIEKSGLNLENKCEYPYQIIYSIANHKEVCLITLTVNDLNTGKVRVTYCWNV